MKRLVLVGVVLLAIIAVSPAHAWNYGDSWILPISELQGSGWVEYQGSGYNGTSAWSANGADGVRRIIWKMDQPDMPTSTELFIVDFWAPEVGPFGWQPIQMNFRGWPTGDQWPMEPGIPWAGQNGTNHQWVGSEFNNDQRETWVATGPGPQAPASSDPNAPGNGIYMWGTKDSWLFAKWDFPWDTHRSWSVVRVTVVPEPASLMVLGAGLASLAGFIRRRK